MSKHRRRSYRDFADMSGFEIELPSSPDPLGDELPPDSARAPPSTARRLLQSTASSRFSALPGTSPRKRMFALDVGDEITPQTIFVTVEAGQEGNSVTKAPAVGSSVRRRLFGSPTPQPSPQRRVRTTTTTVPLRGLTDDEAGPTPRRRRRSSAGRPGTPSAASNKKKKRGTPTPKVTKTSPKKSRATPAPSSDIDILQSETPVLTPRRRGRPPKRKSSTEPTEQDDPNESQTLPRKKGRRRREALGPDDMEENPLNETTTEAEPQRNDGPSLENTTESTKPTNHGALEAGRAAVQAEDEGDIWMDNISDPPVVNELQETDATGGAIVSSDPVDTPHKSLAFPELEDQGALPAESDDYAPMMDYDDRSDVESRRSDQPPDLERNPDELEDQGPLPGESDDYRPITEQMSDDDHGDAESPRNEQPAGLREELDHTVDPESFTMIGIESIPSFRTTRNVTASDPAEIGEGTSLFINKTLDSLRQEIAESDEDEVDILVSRDHTPAGSDPEASAPGDQSPPSRRRVSQSSVKEFSRNSSRSPGRTESVAESIVHAGSYDHANTPAHAVQKSGVNSPRSLVDNITADEDSFSDIPDEVLAAAESQEWHRDLGPNQEAAWAVSFNDNCIQPYGSAGHRESGSLQSSCAPAAQPDLSLTEKNQDASQRSTSLSTQTRRASNQTTERDSPAHSLRSRTDSNRLLTPDATTSSSTQSPHAEHAVADENGMASEDVGSSPPEIMSFGEDIEQHALPSRRNSDTPANKPPEVPVDHGKDRHTLAAISQPALVGGPRPTLSPVVRIGRTLQNILSDPPSPSGASSVLGSPFKGSIRNSSPMDGPVVDEGVQNGFSSAGVCQTHPADQVSQPVEIPARSPKKSWAMSLAPLSQIRNLVTQGTSLFTSPQVDMSQDMEDPFAPSSPTLDKTLDNTRNSAFMDRIKQASREESRPSSRISVRAAIDDDIETHLSAKQVFAPRTGARDLDRTSIPLSNDTVTLKHTQRYHNEASAVYDGALDEDADELAIDQPTELEREDYRPSETTQQEVNDREGSIQGDAIEVPEHNRRDEELSPSPVQHQDQDKAVGDATEGEVQPKKDEQPLTSSIQHQEAEDVEAEEDTMHVDDAPADEEEDEDIWAIEADRTASSPQFTASQHDTSNLFRKSELSVDWGTQSTNSQGLARQGRSPAFTSRRSVRDLPPEDLEDYSLVDLHSGTSAQPSAKKPTPESQTQSKKVDLSDFFSSSPNFIERQRRAKEASLAKSAAQNAVDTSGQVAYPNLADHVKNTVPPSLPGAPRQTIELLSPAPGISQGTRESTVPASSSATPEQARHRVPGQRMTPRHARNDAALFESWSVSSKAPTERPPSSEVSSTPRAVTPLVRDSSSFETADLRALPARAASPSKSCLRSPLKPKTPGRVVEFTSSTISEAAPLQLRAGSQNKAPAASVSSLVVSGSSFPGKENETILPNNAFLQTSPQRKQPQRRQLQQIQQQEQVVDSPLSRTRWSRQHWLFLEDLWQEYQHSPLEFQLRHSKAVMASPRQRRSSSLLGKVISNQGDTLELRQSHLDVVDAFKKEVGGWQEEVLAKRLFALLVGTQRRRLGLVTRRR